MSQARPLPGAQCTREPRLDVDAVLAVAHLGHLQLEIEHALPGRRSAAAAAAARAAVADAGAAAGAQGQHAGDLRVAAAAIAIVHARLCRARALHMSAVVYYFLKVALQIQALKLSAVQFSKFMLELHNIMGTNAFAAGHGCMSLRHPVCNQVPAH